MEKITVEELRSRQLDIMSAIHDYCVSHDIKYSLAYGTLLGAVRHKGYIPWDDDIDIMLPRQDYERLLAGFSHPRFKVVSHNRNPDYCLPFAKIHDSETLWQENANSPVTYGVFVDIFPIDNFPATEVESVGFLRHKKIWDTLHTLKIVKLRHGRSLTKNAALAAGKILALPFSMRSILRHITSEAERYNDADTGWAGVISITDDLNIRYRMPADVFDATETSPFEDREFMIIKAYDRFLTQTYGDYMQLPPEEQRVTHHNYSAWKK